MQPTKENIDPTNTSPKVTWLRPVFCWVFIWRGGGGVHGFKLFIVNSTGRSIDCVMTDWSTDDQATRQSISRPVSRQVDQSIDQ